MPRMRHPWLLGLALVGVASLDAKAQPFPDSPAAWINYAQGTFGWRDELDNRDVRWRPENNYANGDPAFSTCWKGEQITFDDQISVEDQQITVNDVMVIALEPQTKKSPCICGEASCADARYQYRSGLYRTLGEDYHYGTYSIRMQAAEGCGLVTGFFVFYSDNAENPTEWHEIDFEILGKETNKVQVNHKLKRPSDTVVSDNAKSIDLTFDTSEEMHVYTFEWRPNSITWYVDGQWIHQVTIGVGGVTDLPDHKVDIMVSLWAGCTNLWSACAKPVPLGCGEPPKEPCVNRPICYFGNRARASVDWISYTNGYLY